MWPVIVVMSLIVLIGVPVTLWWWKQADKWANGEQRDRPTPKQENPRPPVAKL